MKISYNWLQNYFEEKLPTPEKLAEKLTFSFAEIESIEAIGNAERGGTKTTRNETEKDYVLDAKILPDRACYALSHRGVAYEVAAILGLKQKEVKWPEPSVVKTRPLVVHIEAPELCARYMARVIENITPKVAPWVQEHLEAIGQRSINPIVDGANFVMFDMGQPLHAFDADKVEGKIIVRRAHKGEKITTLDNREVALDESILIIADEKAPLAIAGIKGGKKAEVTSHTQNLILESANFNASHIRKTSERLGLRTDASKRFENNLSPEMAEVGINDFTAFLFEMDKNANVGEVVDAHPGNRTARTIVVSEEYLVQKLGMKLSSGQIEEVLSRLLIRTEREKDQLTLTPPIFRMDLNIPEDIAEEVGRIVGYDKIPTVLPPKTGEAIEIPKSFYYEWKIREILVREGFSEVMTSSFSEQGSAMIEKPLADDKKYARPSLRAGFEKALKMNLLNAPFLGEENTCIFEIGKVFTKDGERTDLAIGVAGPKRKTAGLLESSLKKLSEELGATLLGDTKDDVFECTLDDVLGKLPEPKKWDIKISPAKSEKFASFSLFPFIVRDIALFVSPLAKGVPPSSEAGVVFPSPESVQKIIKKSAGTLLVRGPELFDEFTKDGKKSLAFRLIFQSPEKTLTDEEVNTMMEKVYVALAKCDWQVR